MRRTRFQQGSLQIVKRAGGRRELVSTGGTNSRRMAVGRDAI